MADNHPESDLELGAGGTPSTPASTQGDKQTSVDLDKLADALLERPKLKEALERQTQSVKDKRFKKLDEFQTQLAEMKALMAEGMSERQALRAMTIDDFLTNQPKNPATPVAPIMGGSRKEVPSNLDVDAFLRGMGLDPDDAQYKQLYENPSPNKLVDFVAKRAQPQAKPTQAYACRLPASSMERMPSGVFHLAV